MDQTSIDGKEFYVNEGSFWHINLDLFFGYQTGEVVEVEHEPNKYWLAIIKYSYKQLISLDWLGDYGNFWMDLSNINASSNGLTNSEGHYTPRRLFPLGYHRQSQLKSQFVLERPSKVLNRPTLYDPKADPYGNVENIEDLLALDTDNLNPKDKFRVDNSVDRNESNGLAITKACRAKISYGQEDADELEAALLNLNGEISDSNDIELDFPQPHQILSQEKETQITSNIESGIKEHQIDQNNATGSSSTSGIDIRASPTSSGGSNILSPEAAPPSVSPSRKDSDSKLSQGGGEKTSSENNNTSIVEHGDNPAQEILDKTNLQLCRGLQGMALMSGNYQGLFENNTKFYPLKTKHFYEIGGANHERLILPGTLLEVCHGYRNEINNSTTLSRWFAFVIKNTGGWLTLRWFLCDEPKFKQGRLEFKSSKSKYLKEEELESKEDQSEYSDKVNDNQKIAGSSQQQRNMCSEDGFFNLHYCDPRLQSLTQANPHIHVLPESLKLIVESLSGDIKELESRILTDIFDCKRINLDKDRSLIDHLYSTIRLERPNYVRIKAICQEKNNISNKNKNDINRTSQILVSKPNQSKLIRAYINQEISEGIYEIQSESLDENGLTYRFVYPYENSNSILPLSWSNNNEECVSVPSSPVASPNFLSQSNNNYHIHNSHHQTGDSAKSMVSNLDIQSTDDYHHHHHHHHTSQPSNSKKGISQCVNSSNITLIQQPQKEDDPENDSINVNRSEINENKNQALDSKNQQHHLPITYEPLTPTKLTSQDLSPQPHHDYQELPVDTFLDSNNQYPDKYFECKLDETHKELFLSSFQVMQQLEVVHPPDGNTMWLGRIRKVVYPLLWIQISSDSYTLLPFNSTCLYPNGWSASNNVTLRSLLPPLKRPSQLSTVDGKKRKRLKLNHNDKDIKEFNLDDLSASYEKDQLDLDTISDKPLDISFFIDDNVMFDRIYFNHKCFTGPSLSKGKICSLPQYVGPGPLRLVIQEVVSKIISVAYVPPRILNDLSSKTFHDLLIARNLTNTIGIEFKAKYQKRTHREEIHVCIDPNEVGAYCECICEHLKCCYNLFGPFLYDGDDCPGHCRGLTKSNKFMKRATYYREKARLGEFTNDAAHNRNKETKSQTTSRNPSPVVSKVDSTRNLSRSHEDGQGRSGSSSSNSSEMDQLESRPASSVDDILMTTSKENVNGGGQPGAEIDTPIVQELYCKTNFQSQSDINPNLKKESCVPLPITNENSDKSASGDTNRIACDIQTKSIISKDWPVKVEEFQTLDLVRKLNPNDWTIEIVIAQLEHCGLEKFKTFIVNEGIDGEALNLLDKISIKEHFRNQPKNDFSQEEFCKFYRFLDHVKAHLLNK